MNLVELVRFGDGENARRPPRIYKKGGHEQNVKANKRGGYAYDMMRQRYIIQWTYSDNPEYQLLALMHHIHFRIPTLHQAGYDSLYYNG